MAGFGFSPSDIIEFGKFATKVTIALREEGGSKSEYLTAVRSCEGLQAVLSEIQHLELSNLSGTFSNQIKQHSADAEELIKDFRKTIAKYENSLGQTATKGTLRSAGRKTQWALLAADDLDKFRQSLSAQLDILKLLMQSKILEVVSSAYAGSKQGTTTRDSIGNVHNYLGEIYQSHSLNSVALRQLRLNLDNEDTTEVFNRVEELTSLLYRYLATRHICTSTRTSRVYNLPNGSNASGIAGLPPQFSEFSGHTTADEQITSGRAGDSTVTKHQVSAQQSGWIDEAHNLLRSLDLAELSSPNTDNLRQIDATPTRFLLAVGESSPSSFEPSETEDTARSSRASGFGNDSQLRSEGAHKKYMPPDFAAGLESLRLAISAIGLVAIGIRLSAKSDQLSRATEYSLSKLSALSPRMLQYSQLLRQAASLMGTEMSGALREIWVGVVRDSHNMTERVAKILGQVEKLGVAPAKSKNLAQLRFARWDEVDTVIKELESLKDTLPLMLQMYQMEVSKRSNKNRRPE